MSSRSTRQVHGRHEANGTASRAGGRHRAPKPVGANRRVIRGVGAAAVLSAPLLAVGVVTAAPAVAAPASCASVGVGARGPVVKLIQSTVGATPDGAYGPLTAAAVRTWQTHHRIAASGIVDAATWATFPASVAAACTPVPVVPVVPVATKPTTTTVTSCPTLSRGSKGNAVVILQRRIAVAADGDFGPITQTAVQRAQTQLHLPATGVVATTTWQALGLVSAVCTVSTKPVVSAGTGPPPTVVSVQQQTAAAVVAQVSALEARPDQAPSATASAALAFARAQLGVPYVTGGTTRAGYDCSGLVLASYRAVGVSMLRTAAQQYLEGPIVSLSALRPGDTVYYATNLLDPNTIYHTAIYVGASQMIEAAKPGTLVRLTALRTADLFPGAARPASLIGAGLSLPAGNPSSGNTARQIQTRLVAHGLKVTVDGEYGPLTAAAVKSFQQATHLPATGVVDVATWAALAR